METLPDDFTHLSVHSYFSLLRGTASPEALAERAAAAGWRALALTDKMGLYGMVRFAKACRSAGIKPILGMTLPIAPLPDEPSMAARPSGDLILLARNAAGYRSLCRLASLLQADSQREVYQQSGLPWALLRDHADGLICLTGGHAGWIADCLQVGDPALAARFAARLGGIFQEDAYLSFSPRSRRDLIALESVKIGERFGLRSVAVQPVWALTEEAAGRLPLLAAIRQNRLLEDVGDHSLPVGNRVWQSEEELVARYEPWPEAVSAVGDIVAQCEDVVPHGQTIWPRLALPEGVEPGEQLAIQARIGLAEKLGGISAEYENRLVRELTAINRHGFAPLFLLVADITRFARETDLPSNTRGSVANSLVAFAVGITTVDPIVHNLLFERFLNPARSSLPDIDLDFCSRRRDEVLEYVRRTHGAEKVALVATVSTLQPKSAVRETAKAYGLTAAQAKQLTAVIPRGWHPDPRRREKLTVDEIAARLPDETLRDVLRQAYGIVGQPDHLSVHPGGIVIAPEALTDLVPVQMAPKGFLITQVDHRDLEMVGLPKIDLLGIRALTVLADSAEMIRHFHDPDFRLAQIPLEDAETGDLISAGETVGVFQCESSGAQRTLRQLQARSVADLAVANAFFKPGPATGGMAKAFIRRYRGEEAVSYLHPALAPILGQTQGVLLFQEQILRIATEVAGLSWQQADYLRRGMSKFQPKEMAAMSMQFTLGCQRKPPQGAGFSREQAQTLWEQVLAFAGYGFNQGHATAYADISYRSAYLKRHYPAEFLCARLAGHGGFHHPAIYMAEARRLGLGVMGPHVNVSGKRFTLAWEDGDGLFATLTGRVWPEGLQQPVLWMGLGAVRDLRQASVAAIVTQREQRPFVSLRDLVGRVALQPKELVHLIQCGALDGLGESRAALLVEADAVARAGSAAQMSFGFVQEEMVVSAETGAERFAWELHLLGLPMSVSPLDLGELPPSTPLRDLPQSAGQRVRIVGVQLPGWTGGKGFFLGDGDDYVIVQSRAADGGKKRDVWRVVSAEGRWLVDEWGGGWFSAESNQHLFLI